MKDQFENMSNDTGHLPVAFLRKRKLLMFLPLLVLPFLTFAFWKLGGGAGGLKERAASGEGININLPGANLKNQKPEGKLDIYERQKREAISANAGNAFEALGFDTAGHAGIGKDGNTKPGSSTAEVNESAIHQRLAQIGQEINRPTPRYTNPTNPTSQAYNSNSGNDLDRMERLVKRRTTQNPDDPEMRQLNMMLEKILDIQHPERVAVGTVQQAKTEPDSLYKAVRATIVENQKATEGSTIKLRLTDTLIIHGQVIPKGQFVYGVGQLANQRLILNIKTLRLGTSILPVDLSVYDMDAMPGINAPDAMVSDVIRNGSGNALQSLQLMSLDQSMAAQLAGAGVEAAKGLVGKKIKRIKVRLKAGYPVLLRNNQAKN